jgi:hypothetical protein
MLLDRDRLQQARVLWPGEKNSDGTNHAAAGAGCEVVQLRKDEGIRAFVRRMPHWNYVVYSELSRDTPALQVLLHHRDNLLQRWRHQTGTTRLHYKPAAPWVAFVSLTPADAIDQQTCVVDDARLADMLESSAASVIDGLPCLFRVSATDLMRAGRGISTATELAAALMGGGASSSKVTLAGEALDRYCTVLPGQAKQWTTAMMVCSTTTPPPH